MKHDTAWALAVGTMLVALYVVVVGWQVRWH